MTGAAVAVVENYSGYFVVVVVVGLETVVVAVMLCVVGLTLLVVDDQCLKC